MCSKWDFFFATPFIIQTGHDNVCNRLFFMKITWFFGKNGWLLRDISPHSEMLCENFLYLWKAQELLFALTVLNFSHRTFFECDVAMYEKCEKCECVSVKMLTSFATKFFPQNLPWIVFFNIFKKKLSGQIFELGPYFCEICFAKVVPVL